MDRPDDGSAVSRRKALFSFGLAAAFALRPSGPARAESTAAPRRYSTAGVVLSFGPERAYVNIRHEDIPGLMPAMAMSFRPRNAAQLASLRQGLAVRFTFTIDAEGRRWIDAISPAPR